MTIIYLLTVGTGTDAAPWDVLSIHRTREGAELAQLEAGEGEVIVPQIEEWELHE